MDGNFGGCAERSRKQHISRDHSKIEHHGQRTIISQQAKRFIGSNLQKQSHQRKTISKEIHRIERPERSASLETTFQCQCRYRSFWDKRYFTAAWRYNSQWKWHHSWVTSDWIEPLREGGTRAFLKYRWIKDASEFNYQRYWLVLGGPPLQKTLEPAAEVRVLGREIKLSEENYFDRRQSTAHFD